MSTEYNDYNESKTVLKYIYWKNLQNFNKRKVKCKLMNTKIKTKKFCKLEFGSLAFTNYKKVNLYRKYKEYKTNLLNVKWKL